MNETVAVGARHLVIDLGHDVMRHLGRSQRGIHANPKTAEAVGIGRRNFDERHVNRHRAALKQAFNLAEVYGSVVGAALADGVAHIGPDEHGIVAKMPFHLGRHIRRAAHRHHVDDLHIMHLRGAAHQRFDQSLWFGTARLNVDSHPGANQAQRIIRCHEATFIMRFPGHARGHLVTFNCL